MRSECAGRAIPLSVPAAIHGEIFTIDESRFRVCQEGHGRSNLFRLAETADAGELLHNLGNRAVVVRAEFSVDRSRLDAIDGHSGRPQLARQTSCKSVNANLVAM